jgi:uncharacterized membrane protein
MRQNLHNVENISSAPPNRIKSWWRWTPNRLKLTGMTKGKKERVHKRVKEAICLGLRFLSLFFFFLLFFWRQRRRRCLNGRIKNMSLRANHDIVKKEQP